MKLPEIYIVALRQLNKTKSNTQYHACAKCRFIGPAVIQAPT